MGMTNTCLLMAHILMCCLSLISTLAQAPVSSLNVKYRQPSCIWRRSSPLSGPTAIQIWANSMKDACHEDESGFGCQAGLARRHSRCAVSTASKALAVLPRPSQLII